MSLVNNLTPTNLLEEKEKFFADSSYNPQFQYKEPIKKNDLTKYGFPENRTLDLAKEIIDKAYYQRSETQLRELRGKSVDQQEVKTKIKQFLKMHSLEERYELIWSKSFVARVTITNQAMKLRLPAEFRELGLLGMLYHEIGTHALRRINYEQQPWFRKKKKYGFKSYLATEEGLAAIHGLIPYKLKLAHSPALNYLAVEYARQHSFAEVFEFLTPYIDDLNRRFIFAFRKKRGLTDTSKPGGFTKDLTYFEGFIEVWQYLKEHDFNPTKLYFGKMAWQDVEKAIQLNPHFQPELPSFYKINPEAYEEELNKIGLTNFLK